MKATDLDWTLWGRMGMVSVRYVFSRSAKLQRPYQGFEMRNVDISLFCEYDSDRAGLEFDLSFIHHSLQLPAFCTHVTTPDPTQYIPLCMVNIYSLTKVHVYIYKKKN